jgi:acyl-homoserine-lactone acylase
MKNRHPLRSAVAVGLAVFVGTGVLAEAGQAADSDLTKDGGYEAQIRRASYGVPHITAAGFADLGFGAGYAQAEDNICLIAQNMITVDAERARSFGATGPSDPNVQSDLFFQKAKDTRVVEQLLAGTGGGPAPSRNARDLVRGFAAGYNAYLRRTGVNQLPDPQCAGKSWVRQITELDLWRSHWTAMTLAGSGALIDAIATATPPAPGEQTAATATALTANAGNAVLRGRVGDAGLGSNAYGLGREATQSGNGMLLANPHFPWDGAERFYRMHLKIPGVYDVEGAGLIGDPIVEIGHNATLGWSHTVATSWHMVWHKLKLVPGDPTSYLFDGRPRKMTKRTVTVQTSSAQGETVPVTRTLYDTHFGPVVVIPGRNPWTASTAYAITDVNATNVRGIDGWIAMGKARSVRDLKAALDRHQFLPWINVVGADSRGEAMYGDRSVIPRVTDQLADTCIPAEFKPAYAATGEAVLDGSTSACDLGSDPDAVVPHILGPASLPVLFRTDYVTNSNDSHWLANPQQPLTGFPRVIGEEKDPLSLRTRLGLRQVQQRLTGKDGLSGTEFSIDSLWKVALGNRVYGAELVRDDLVRLCTKHPEATTTQGERVDLSQACAALRAWDLRVNLDSRGAHVFNEFANSGGMEFKDPFLATDPVNTPRRLDTKDPRVLTALADAVQRLSGIPLNARLGDIQTEPRDGQRIPIHGGPGRSGIFNVITAPLAPGIGYPKVVHGTSFLMAAQFGPNGPTGRQVLTYSQSANPNSPHSGDQTKLYSRKGWDTIKYTEAQITADPNLRTYTVRSD